MKSKTKSLVVLILALSLISFGAFRGEVSVVLDKGISLCLECVGIG